VLSLPRIPDAQDQAGPLYPPGHCGHWATGTTGVLWVQGGLDHCTHWDHRATVPTGPLWVLGHSGHCIPLMLQRTGVQAGWATAVQLSYRTATACTPAGQGTVERKEDGLYQKIGFLVNFS